MPMGDNMAMGDNTSAQDNTATGGNMFTGGGGMPEAAGVVGRTECQLRATDRVLRQHPTKYNAVRRALSSFISSPKEGENVSRYFNCVVGEGLLLPDCGMDTFIRPLSLDDVKTYLQTTGLDQVNHIEVLINQDPDSHSFHLHRKQAEQV